MATSPFVPEDERAEYVKPDFLKKVAALEPVDWLPKIQAKKFRLDNELFETNTPKAAKEKLRAAAPAGASVFLYKNMEEFKAAFQNGFSTSFSLFRNREHPLTLPQVSRVSGNRGLW
jgi:hypothetical protein